MPQPASSTAPIDLQQVFDDGRLKAVQIRVFVICALVALLDGIDNQSIGIVAPLLARDLDLNPAQLGIVFSIAQVGATLGALAFGPLADRYGRKPMLLLATAIIALFTCLTALSPSFGVLLGVRMLAGVGLAGVIPPVLALTSEYAPRRLRGTLVTAIFAAYPLGGAIGGFFNAWLLGQYDWRMVFYIGSAMPLLVIALIGLFLPESLFYLFGKAAGGGRRAANVLRQLDPALDPTRVRAPIQTGGAAKPKGSIKMLFGDGRAVSTLLLWGLYFFAFAATKIMVTWFPSLLKDAGFDLQSASTALGFFNIGATVGMACAGILVDRLGAFRALTPALVAAGVCVMLLGLVPASLGVVILVATLIGLFVGIGGSGAHAIAVAIYPPEVRSTGLGFGVAASRLGQVVSPSIVGLMLSAGLGSQSVYFTIALSPVLAAVMVGALWWTKRTTAVPTQPAAV